MALFAAALSSTVLHSGPDDDVKAPLLGDVVNALEVVVVVVVAACIILLHIVEAKIADVHSVFSDSALGEDTSTCPKCGRKQRKTGKRKTHTHTGE